MGLLPIKAKIRKHQSGQALLLVLLSMAVVLTIVLSVLSRTITDITVTTKEEEALRAFAAAEAGVERALIIGTNSREFENGASFTATISNFGQLQSEYVYPEKLLSGETAVIWFVDHDEEDGSLTCNTNDCFTGSSIKICWGEPGTASDSDKTPAIETSIFYAATPGNYSTMRIARDARDPNATRRSSNSFQEDGTGITCVIDGQEFAFQKFLYFDDLDTPIPGDSYNFPDGLQFAKIRILYNDIAHNIGVDVSATGNDLPSQGVKIVSAGSSGEANRRIEVFQTFGELPPIFDAVIFTTGGIVK
jgi:Tfp pilus assembly protein PilX